MSTIKVDNIRIASESVSRPATGVAAAWVNFNGETVTLPNDMTGVRDSLNVSGIVDNNVGEHIVNFSNFTSTAHFTSAVGSGGTASTITSDIAYQDWKTTSTCRVGHYENGNAVDSDSMTLSIHGDLA